MSWPAIRPTSAYDDIPEARRWRAYRRACTRRWSAAVTSTWASIEAGAAPAHCEGGVLGFICADRWMRSATTARSAARGMICAQHSGSRPLSRCMTTPAFDKRRGSLPGSDHHPQARPGRAQAIVPRSADAGLGPRPLPDGGILADGRSSGPGPGGRTDAVPGFAATTVGRWFPRGTSPWPSLEPQAELRPASSNWRETLRPTLEDKLTGTKIGIGVATGADRVFITTDPRSGRKDPTGSCRSR